MPSLKKKRLTAALLAKKKAAKKIEKVNPFEVRVNKKKHDVLGQKNKSDKGLPGVARSKAVKKRKKTLLVEYQQRNKSNQFVDRRFGEYDDQLTVEEKMMKRFTLERKRKHERSTRFNLDDDDEEGLTHYGQSIGDMERFDHIELSEEEHELEDIGETHFGGFLRKKRKISEEEEAEKPAKQRSRKEIMEEVVANSKAMKYKQQSERQDVEELLDKINTEWRVLKTTAKFPADEQKGGKAQKSLVDDYDRAVRELAFERRGQPTDRLKTEEEVAKEEKERLEKLEADRLRRMKGVASSGEDLVTESADYIKDRPANKKRVQFTLEYKDGKIVLPLEEGSDCEGDDAGGGSEAGDTGGESEDSDAEDDMSEVSDAGGGSEGSEACDSGTVDSCSVEGDPGAEYGSDLDSENSELQSEDDEVSSVQQLLSKKYSQNKIKKLASKELPYTFSVPKSLKELQAIVMDRSPEECVTAIERIHSCNHPSIDPMNRSKLEEFLSIFVDYCTSLGEHPTMNSVKTLNGLARPLYKFSQLSPLHTAQVFRNKLELSRQLWVHNGLRCYPPLSQLLLFKLIAVIFPTSDFEHPVTTPALLFMGQLLTKCHVKSLCDLFSGLLVCQIVIEYIAQSKRFMPELVNFLTSVIGFFTIDNKGIRISPLTGKLSQFISVLTAHADLTREPNSTLLSLIVNEDHETENIGCCVLKTALSALSRLIALYSYLPSFSELFAPISTNLHSAMKRNWPSSLKDMLTETLELIHSKGGEEKRVLQLLKQKPKSIKFYEPKFDEVYEVNRKKARSKSMGEQKKLKYKIKKETKGAIREIRKDAAFLAKERLSERLQLDTERAAKTKKILHDLQMGQHEVKQERRKKRK